MSERGFALVTVVLFVIGLAVLATGLAFAAAQEAAVVRTTHDLIRARHAAQAAVEAALSSWSAVLRAADPLHVDVPLMAPAELEAGVRMSATSRRVARDGFLVSGIGTAGSGTVTPVRQRAVRLARSLAVDSIGAALDAALLAGAAHLGAGAVVDAARARVPSGDGVADELCARWPSGGAGVRAPLDSVALAAGAVVRGAPAVVHEDDAGRFRTGFGFLDAGALRAAARRVEAAALTPAPVESGLACDTAASGNWGGTAGPCASYRPLLHAAGALVLSGGYGQGILLADGDLVLERGFAFRGIILASGSVTVRDATVEGALVAARVAVERGELRLDRCAVAAALAAPDVLRRPWIPARSWLPAFD